MTRRTTDLSVTSRLIVLHETVLLLNLATRVQRVVRSAIVVLRAAGLEACMST